MKGFFPPISRLGLTIANDFSDMATAIVRKAVDFVKSGSSGLVT